MACPSHHRSDKGRRHLDQTTFFLVSDHGFAAVSRRFEPNVVLVKEKLITLNESGKPTSWKAAAWPAGGSSAIVLHDAGDKETERRVTQIFSGGRSAVTVQSRR
jgi:hypothetical protein